MATALSFLVLSKEPRAVERAFEQWLVETVPSYSPEVKRFHLTVPASTSFRKVTGACEVIKKCPSNAVDRIIIIVEYRVDFFYFFYFIFTAWG